MPRAALRSSGGCQPLWTNMALSSEVPINNATTPPANANQPPQKTSATTIGMSTSAESDRWPNAANQAFCVPEDAAVAPRRSRCHYGAPHSSATDSVRGIVCHFEISERPSLLVAALMAKRLKELELNLPVPPL